MNSEFAIQTRSGRFVDPFDPDPDDILIEDVAHALSNQCRFSGHTSRHFSVASHSIIVSSWCRAEARMWGLLHDATEAYLIDLPSPIKRHARMGVYRELESNLMKAVAAKFKLPLPIPGEVKEADTLSLVAEAKVLMSNIESYADWPKWKGLDTKPFEAMIHGLLLLPDPPAVEAAFLDRYHRLRFEDAIVTTDLATGEVVRRGVG